MSDDVRIATSLRSHRKTKRLKRLLGKEGCWSLICLFLWVGAERWTGDLTGLSDADIEEEADWDGEPGALVAALLEVKFLVGSQGKRRIHEWAEHNPFAAAKGERIERGKAGANARWGRKKDADTNGSGIAPASGLQCPPAPTPTPTSQDSLPQQAPNSHSPTEAGRACRLMRDAGCASSNPSHPDLLAALAEGVSPEALADTAREGIAAGKGRPFAWAIATARSRHAEGAAPVATGPPRSAGKTAQGIQLLEGLKHGLADAGNFDGVPEASVPRLGSPARG